MMRIAFDLDGTLIHSAPGIRSAINAVLEELGAEALSLAQVTGFIGNGTLKLVERSLRASGLAAEGAALEAAHERLGAVYGADPTRETTLFPGVRGALDSLKAQGHSLTICTNKPAGPARDILKHFAIDGYFDLVVGGDSLPTRKPEPEMLHKALCGGDTVAYVGDSDVDAETARRAEVRFGLFTEGYRHASVDALAPDFRFSDFAALPALVAG
ncbi:phosphoglycolate phosphatase [Oceanibium sediminis]|uniref:phosphoglycolate phosphatase n=1 Tax=Oceanibium sediminis TaxID=2026339 RepID=UPI000DD398D2|nr:phosphoglycolate phosphatase [Oceanibium sediminis]